MSNLSENRINGIISDPDLTTMRQNVQDFIDLLPKNTSLTDEQRSRFSSINVANKVFAEDVLEESSTLGTEILPAFIKLAELEADLKVFNQLDSLENALNNALQRLQDAKRIAGHEAFGQSTAIYNAVKLASDAGIPNAKAAYTKLKVRFDAQGKSGGRPPEELT